MTGGQGCSTTPLGAVTHTTPGGNRNRPFDLCALVRGAGAKFAARYLVTQGGEMVNAIKEAISMPGFAFVEALSPCPTQFGRQNRMDSAKEAFSFVEAMTCPQADVEEDVTLTDDRLLVTGAWR
jgi:2-oxoglutarate ferredoxin oxidoreductase subunit beta